MTVGGFFAEYGLFVAELLTVLALFGIVIAVIVVSVRRGTGHETGLNVEHLNKKIERQTAVVKRALLGKERFKKDEKARKKAKKAERKHGAKEESRPRLFVVDFKGDIRATGAASLREEITAILGVAGDGDAVLLRLENPGGTVHEHGFAASQLLRLKERKIPLTVAIDKVAASGGYLMACVAEKIIAAPFAIVGSIGVIAQLPNFHRWLQSRGIDFEQVTAGRFKRTLTLFGENTEEGREKLKSELEEVHRLFKNEVSAHRPALDLDAVSTGEHWYGLRALELGLVDEIRTSDDFLLAAVEDWNAYQVTYRRTKSVQERLLGSAESLLIR